MARVLALGLDPLERDNAAQDAGPAVRVNQDYTTLRLALLSHKRAA